MNKDQLPANNANQVKVAILLDHGPWEVETLWADPISYDRYRLRNIPFAALGYSFHDVVTATLVGDQLTVTGVAERGGHSTYHVLLSEPLSSDQLEPQFEPLQKLGCHYEGGGRRMLAIDVPPDADIDAVCELLAQGEQPGVWEVEEGHCGHALRCRTRYVQ